jgi:hypothetical protein
MTTTDMFAAVSMLASGVAAHRRRVVELGSRTSLAAKLLVRIAPCLALLGLASAATAQQPAPGQWGMRAPLLEPLSELALAETNGKLYLMGGYPQNRVSSRIVQGLRHRDQHLDLRTAAPAAEQPRDGRQREREDLPHRRPVERR